MRNISIFYANEMQLPKTQNQNINVQMTLFTKRIVEEFFSKLKIILDPPFPFPVKTALPYCEFCVTRLQKP